MPVAAPSFISCQSYASSSPQLTGLSRVRSGIGFSLVAVFVPRPMMGGIVGRLFREFAVTLSVATGVPRTALSRRRTNLQPDRRDVRPNSERRPQLAPITPTLLPATIGLNVYLFIRVPKGVFPGTG